MSSFLKYYFLACIIRTNVRIHALDSTKSTQKSIFCAAATFFPQLYDVYTARMADPSKVLRSYPDIHRKQLVVTVHVIIHTSWSRPPSHEVTYFCDAYVNTALCYITTLCMKIIILLHGSGPGENVQNILLLSDEKFFFANRDEGSSTLLDRWISFPGFFSTLLL